MQKGDTLWELSKKYGVDYEELLAANSHFSSPDMVMPGMKIRIPTTAKAVKKEAPIMNVQKEAPIMNAKEQPKVEQPYKDISPKPLPVIKEDDKKPIMEVKPEMPLPQMPQMPQLPQMTLPQITQAPTLDQEFTTNMMINIHETNIMEESSEESSHEKEKPTMQKPIQQQPVHQPIFHQPMYQPLHMIPCYPVHSVHPCCAGHFPMPMHPIPVMPPQMVQPSQMMPMQENDCGCGGGSNYDVPQMGGMQPFNSGPMMGMQGDQMGMSQMQPMMGMQGDQMGIPQMQPTMMFPMMEGFQTNNFPTPPGFGELRNETEEESSD